ncbi:hypothetical protein ACFPYJ_25065 [Paenibacillus solisilvae]|uniref:LPS export ABC transporter periplasmic protein LptC n=1 Tax=Paenibacillus solisilvae TaxID=2486751 RepID=A0ABW0W4E7_9BACL
MTMRDKYANGMNEIKMDDERKQAILNRINPGHTEPSAGAAWSIRGKIVMAAAACILLFLFVLGGPNILHLGNQAGSTDTTLFRGFVITAYAADGAPQTVKPDVEFPLGQYSPLMSSVPGFPITISAKDADEIRLHTSEGELLRWSPQDSKVRPQGNEASLHPGDTIYWSPLAKKGQSPLRTKSIIEITAYKDDALLGSSTIEIQSDDRFTYRGKLTND